MKPWIRPAGTADAVPAVGCGFLLYIVYIVRIVPGKIQNPARIFAVFTCLRPRVRQGLRSSPPDTSSRRFGAQTPC